MSKIKWWVLICNILLFFHSSVYAQSQQLDTQQVRQAFYAWCSAVGTAKGDAAKMVRYYAPDALLIPTLSSDFLVNKDGGLNAYFTKFTSHPHIQCTPDRLIIHIHDRLAVSAGAYHFSYMENSNKKIIPARFTFIYQKINGSWLITQQHSSVMP